MLMSVFRRSFSNKTVARCLSCNPYVVPRPVISNAFEEDPILYETLKRHFPPMSLSEVATDLSFFGKRVVNDILDLSERCEREKPELQNFDCWGNQSNKLLLSSAWKDMKSISATEGLVSIPYERKFAEFSRLYHLAKLYLYMPSSGLYGCPLAMTDGAIQILEGLKTPQETIVDDMLKRLTSRDPGKFYTSGQWMTEIRGGCDVATATETIAIPQANGKYRLYGYKFFTSAADADITITLARVASTAKGEGLIPGNQGLALFLLETHDEKGNLNNLRMVRLKDKLGTRQLATAEMILDGSLAYKLCETGRGIAEVSKMLVVTRFWAALGSASAVRRMSLLARDYATRREAFGKTLDQHCLHVSVLGQLEMEARVGFLLLFRMAQLMGLLENGRISPGETDLLRVIMPLAKGFICKRSMPILSEGLEAFGGQGYMEDSGIPVIFRDAQVQPIWEGTTNIQAIDLLRAVKKTKGTALKALLNDVERLTTKTNHVSVLAEIEKVANSAFAPSTAALLSSSEAAAKDFLMALGGFYSAALLYDHAAFSGRGADMTLADRWYYQGKAEWGSIVKKTEDGYYCATSRDHVKEAVFRNHCS